MIWYLLQLLVLGQGRAGHEVIAQEVLANNVVAQEVVANTVTAQEVLVVEDVIEVGAGVVDKEVLNAVCGEEGEKRFVVTTAVSRPDYDFLHFMRARKSEKCSR